MCRACVSTTVGILFIAAVPADGANPDNLAAAIETYILFR